MVGGRSHQPKTCLCVSMAACRKVCLAHLFAHMHLLSVVIFVIGGRAMSVIMCMVFLCCVCKSSINVHTKPKKYNHFDILVGGGGDLKFDHVSFLDYFVYRAGDAPMIFLFHCEKAIQDTADCRLVFTRGQFWPSGIVVACVCVCVCLSICVSITCLSAR